jgi:hypothetical protein
MASPNTTFVSGAILTAAQQNNFPFGMVVAPVSITANQTGITAVTDVTGATATWTTISGRNYRINFQGQHQSGTALSLLDIFITDATPTTYCNFQFQPTQNGTDYSFGGSFVFQASSNASITRKLRVSSAGGTGQISASATVPFQYWIEDIGTA